MSAHAPESESPSSVLISAAELDAAIHGHQPPPLLLDVRWKLADPDGHAHYLKAHIPGAVYVDLPTELAGPASPEGGRHPLPEISKLQAAARRWGLMNGQAVVVYDDFGGMSAARAWWLLRWAGVKDVRILDGALSAWTRAGLPVEPGEVQPQAGDVKLSAGHLPALDAGAAAAIAADGLLLDARAAERYRGEVEPIDPRAGHIPGALSASTADNLDAVGNFLDPDQLAARFTALGALAGSPVGVYCGSGVTASHLAAALEIAGFQPILFPGSWSAWSADPRRPVATGPQPYGQPAA